MSLQELIRLMKEAKAAPPISKAERLQDLREETKRKTQNLHRKKLELERNVNRDLYLDSSDYDS